MPVTFPDNPLQEGNLTKLLDLSGRTYGYLTVINRAPNRTTSGGNSVVHWNCLCSCGNTKIVSGNGLQQDKTKSCGCYLVEDAIRKGRANKKHGGYSNLASPEFKIKCQALANIKERAKKGGYISDLEIDDLPDLTERCPIFGKPYSAGTLKDKDYSPSIDRKNTSLPYLKKFRSNLKFISHRANRIKSNSTIAELKLILEYMQTMNSCRASGLKTGCE